MIERSLPEKTPLNGSAHSNGSEYSRTVTVEELAQRHNLKPQKVKDEIEYHGANFLEAGATKDGFILKSDGKAFDRNGRRYTSREVETLSGLAYNEYEPCREYSQRNGATFNGNGHSAPKLPQTPATSPAPETAPKAPHKPFDWTRAVIHDYRDEIGALLFQVGRIGNGDEKQISQRRPDGRGSWIYKLENTRRVLYRFPDVLHARTVLICEGEKDADAVNAALEVAGVFGEIVATTAPHGAGKFREEYADTLREKTNFVLPDNDPQGDVGGDATLRVLAGAGIEARRVELPDLPHKGGAADFLAAGGTVETLLALCDAAPKWTPAPDAPEAASTREVKPAFELLTLRELEARPSPDWLIPDVITCGKTSLMTAKHASFKSFMTLGMGLCVAGGLPWYGRGVARGAVIYVAAEGASGITKRARAWCIENACEMPRDFHVIDKPAQIHNEATRRAFVETIAAVSPVLIILDTLARCAVGMDENSARDMGEFADALGQLAEETGAHVMTVHHNNKGGEYRGSSAVPAAVDTHLSLERDGRGDTVVLKCEKQKDAEEFKPMTFSKAVIDWNQGRDDSLVFRLEQSGGDAYGGLTNSDEKVLCELLEGYGETGATHSVWKRLCADAGIAERTATRSIHALHKKEYVACPDAGKRGAVYTPNIEKCARFSSQCQNGLAPTFKGDTDPIDTETASSESENAAFTTETAFSEFSAKMPMALTGTDGTDQNAEGAKVPHSFRSGTDGTDGARKEISPETAPALPEMPPPSARKKQNANADSEPDRAPEITPDESAAPVGKIKLEI
jgi:hypothetical protein